MYLLDLFHSGAAHCGSGGISFRESEEALRKWTFLPAGADSTEILRLAALACAGKAFVPRLGAASARCRGSGQDLHLEVVAVLHPPRDGVKPAPLRIAAGVQITTSGAVRPLRAREFERVPAGLPRRTVAVSTGNKPWFFVAYGPSHAPGSAGDRFDFSDPFFRLTRFRSLFSRGATLTHPVTFLAFLHHKAYGLSRYPARQTLDRLARCLGTFLGIDTEAWTGHDFDSGRVWEGLALEERRVLLPLFDAVRHAFDASPFQPQPLDIPGLVLFDRPDRFVPRAVLPRWMALVDALFPQLQVVSSLGAAALAVVPKETSERRLCIPTAPEPPQPKRLRPPSVPTRAVLLVDVDGSLPNLALMKLSRHFKEQGRPVLLARKNARLDGAEAVFASAVFSGAASQRRLTALQKHYGDALVCGGTGVNVSGRLPREVEELPADLDLYPELGDRALGFLTRGCPFHCSFCLVPEKEGPPRQVSDLDSLLQGRSRLVLLDDNLLAHPRADELLEEMVRRDLQVNFNQTLDLRLVDAERAALLRRLRCSNTRFTRRATHFSLNHAKGLDALRQKYNLFGFRGDDNVEFVCMYGYDTTLAEDVARFRFLRSLPGAYVFVQEYRPLPGGPAAEVQDFFGADPDPLLRELVSICFTQNMKSMEKYYRWVSRKYAQTYGRLHHDLVETIFRYNQRWRKGVYLATLAGTVSKAEGLGTGP